MKKIGRQVNMLGVSEGNPRNGEGSFIKLRSGAIAYAFTEFKDTSREDEANADITVIYSYDNGESWSDRKVLFKKPNGSTNLMSHSFLEMYNGDIGAFYIEKDANGTDTVFFRRSSNDMATWSDPINCLKELPEDYYVINNDRVLRLANGRILLPLARHSVHAECEDFSAGVVLFVYSDDDGKSWHKTEEELVCPFPNDPNGFQEPGLYQLPDGKIWCYIRTGLGFQFKAYSSDNGESWTLPEPDVRFSSPCSPMLVKYCCDKTVAIFNPIPEHVLRDDDAEFWGRTPYVIAVSDDNGVSFTKEKLFYLEDDLNNGYCYPAVYDGGDYALVAYYHSNGSDCCLNSNKIIKINKDELD